MNVFLSALEQSLILLPLIFGVYISYRILRITDLTVDGTYVLGAAIFARTIDIGLLPAMILSLIGGAFIGSIVAYMQKNNRINNLVAGILASFMLYSVNLQVLGRPNISLLDMPNILSIIDMEIWIIPLSLISCCLAVILALLLKSNLGLFLRAFGHNQKLLNILGKKPETYRVLGLCISNSLASLSGVLSAQVNGFADINMGIGIAIIGIGAVVIGRHILTSFLHKEQNFSAYKEIAACFIGILLYFISLNTLLHAGINPINLKLILGIILFLSLRKVAKL